MFERARMAVLVFALTVPVACGSRSSTRCPGGQGCPAAPSINPSAGGPPHASIVSPDYRRFYRSTLPVEVLVDTSGDVMTLDVLLDGDVTACSPASGSTVVQHFGSPPFIGAIDVGRLTPGVHRISALARDHQGRCDVDRRSLFVDRAIETEVDAARFAPDGQTVAFTAGSGASEPGLHRIARNGARSRYLDGDVAAGDFRFAEHGPLLAYLSTAGGTRALWADTGLEPWVVDRGVAAFAPAPDGASLAYVKTDGRAYLRGTDHTTAGAARLLTSRAEWIAYASGGRTIVTGVAEGEASGAATTVSAFDAASGASLFTLYGVRSWQSVAGSLVILRDDASATGRRLDAVPLVVGGEQAATLLSLDARTIAVDVARDGRTVMVVADGQGQVLRFDASGAPQVVVRAVSDVAGARLAPDGSRAVLALRGATGREGEGTAGPMTLASLDLSGTAPGALETLLTGAAVDSSRTFFAPVGGALAYVDGEQLWVWPSGAASGRLVAQGVVDAVFSPATGSLLAYRSVIVDNGIGATVGVVDLTQASLPVSTLAARSSIASLWWSPSERALATLDGLGDACGATGPCRSGVTLWARAAIRTGPATFLEERVLSASARPVEWSADGASLLALGRGAGADDATLLLTGTR